MKSIKQIILVLLVLYGFDQQTAYSQAFEKILTQSDYSGSFFNLSNKTNRFYDTATGSNRSGYKQWKRFEWFAAHHLSEDGKFENYLQKNATALQSFNQLKTNSANALNSTTGNWINIGHASASGGSSSANQGRVNTVAFDPVNGDVVYIGAAGGGIWKTTNGGASWVNLTIDLPILGISDIAVVPAPNNNIIYALSGEGLPNANVYFHKGIGVIKSTDGGFTWQTTGPVNTLGQQMGGNKLLIHPTNPNYVLAAMSNGLFRTTDGGNVWTNIVGGDINDIEFKPNNPNILYMAIRGNSNLGILNLTTLNRTNIGIFAPPTPPTNAPGVTRMEIAVTPANGNAVYVLAGPGYVSGSNNLFFGLYYSNNGGLPLPNGNSSFTLRSNQCSNNGDLFNSARDLSWYANTIYVSPFNENNVIVGGLNLFNSNDGGVTLNQINDPTIHADQHDLKRNPVTGDIWLCNDGGVYKSTNSGVDWSNTSDGLIINEYYRISGTQTTTDHLIGGLQDNGHFLRAPGTNVYSLVMGSDGMDNYFNSFNNNIVYACIQNGGLNRSTNGGLNFSADPLPTTGIYSWITPIIQHPPDIIPPIGNFDIIYAYSGNGIRQRKDGGTWVNMGLDGFRAASGSLSPSMAIGSNDGGATANLYISNGSNFWVHTNPWFADSAGWVNRPLPINATTYISAIAVHPANKNDVCVTISGYNAGQKVYRSTNAGATWINISLSLPNTPVYSIVFANNNNNPFGAVYIGTEIGVFYKDDNLPDWVPFSNGLPHVPITDMQMNYVNNTLKAATYGRGIWQSDLFQTCRPVLNINWGIYQGQYNFEASQIINADSLIHGGIGTRVTMKAGNKIRFRPGFKASLGTYTRAAIGNCGSGPLLRAESLGVKTDSVKIISNRSIPAALKNEEK